MDLSEINLGPLGTIPLFQPGDHAKLDGYLGLAPNHATLPDGGLGDNVVFDKNTFAPYKNTVQMTKLMFLDGATLDSVMTALTGQAYSYYGGKETNLPTRGQVMITPWDGAKKPTGQYVDKDGVTHTIDFHETQQWLRSIDDDHPWQRPSTFDAKGVGDTGGVGNFPLWEEDVARPAFRKLFDDWQYLPSTNYVRDESKDFPDAGYPTYHKQTDKLNNVKPGIIDGLNSFKSWLQKLSKPATAGSGSGAAAAAAGLGISIPDALTRKLPLLDKSIFELLDIPDLVQKGIVDPVVNYLITLRNATSDELVGVLRQV
jgi:hypothetical protein